MTKKKLLQNRTPKANLILTPELGDEIVRNIADLLAKNAPSISQVLEDMEDGTTLPVNLTVNLQPSGASVPGVEVILDYKITERHQDKRKIDYDPAQGRFQSLDGEAIAAQEEARKAAAKASKADDNGGE